eukprot:1403679-Lingulodinium_polyedra.AAC.1
MQLPSIIQATINRPSSSRAKLSDSHQTACKQPWCSHPEAIRQRPAASIQRAASQQSASVQPA